MTQTPWTTACWLGACCALWGWGCATMPYEYGRFREAGVAAPPIVVEYGEPRKVLDRMNRIVHAPARLLFPKSRIAKRQTTPATVERLKQYLVENDLTDVPIFVDCYDPREQWRRLRENKEVAPVWRYSLGAFSVVGYTVMPGRVFGGDRYNPYTNSLNLYSDLPALVLHEAAFAKNIHSRERPGAYAAVTALPIVSLWREREDVADVIGYAQAHDDWELEKEAYHVLYPRVAREGATVGGLFLTSWWGGPVLSLGGAAIGHGVGRTVASRRQAEVDAALAAAPASTDPIIELPLPPQFAFDPTPALELPLAPPDPFVVAEQ